MCHCQGAGGHGSSPQVSVAVHIPDVSPIFGCDLPWKIEVAQPAGVVDPLFIKVLRPVARRVLDRLAGLPLSSFPATNVRYRVSGEKALRAGHQVLRVSLVLSQPSLLPSKSYRGFIGSNNSTYCEQQVTSWQLMALLVAS